MEDGKQTQVYKGSFFPFLDYVVKLGLACRGLQIHMRKCSKLFSG